MKFYKIPVLAIIALLATACAKEPVAGFTFTITDNTAPAEVTFTNTSTDAKSYRWDFGDGGTSTEENPVHIFETPGTFDVSLLAKGSGGDQSITKSITIDQATSYIIKNQLSIALYNVSSFYWDGANINEQVDHGTLNPGNQSQEVFTNYTEIDIYFETADGTAYISTYPWVLTENARNNINITGDSYFTEVTASKKGTEAFNHQDWQRIRDIGSAVLLREIER